MHVQHWEYRGWQQLVTGYRKVIPALRVEAGRSQCKDSLGNLLRLKILTSSSLKSWEYKSVACTQWHRCVCMQWWQNKVSNSCCVSSYFVILYCVNPARCHFLWWGDWCCPHTILGHVAFWLDFFFSAQLQAEPWQGGTEWQQWHCVHFVSKAHMALYPSFKMVE